MRRFYVLMLIMTICICPAMARKVKYDNGDVYKGKWKHGAPNGKGEMYYHDGRVYTGFWVNGQKNGQGKYIVPINGDTVIFDGIWLNDTLQQGTLSSPQYIFSGTFGYGIAKPYKGSMIFFNGDRYDGEFAEDGSLLNGHAHISRITQHVDGKNVYGETEDMEYLDGKRYEGTYCTDTTYYRYRCGNYHKGKFSGVCRDSFPQFGLTKVFYTEDSAYRIEFNDTCFMEGVIKIEPFNNSVIKFVRGEILIDTGGIYQKGAINEEGLFTGISKSIKDNYKETKNYVNGVLHSERRTFTIGKSGYQEGEWRGDELYNGVSKIETEDYEEDGRYINGCFHGKTIYKNDVSGYNDGEWRGGKFYNGVCKIKTKDYELDGKYINGQFNGKKTFKNGVWGYHEGEWKDGKLYNGVSKIRIDSYKKAVDADIIEKIEIEYEQDGIYVNGVFRGKIKAKEFYITEDIMVKDFEGDVFGDTITGSMWYENEDSFDWRNYMGSVIKGERQGKATYGDCQSRWRNDTLIYLKGPVYAIAFEEWIAEIILKGQKYYISHYYKGQLRFKNTCQYDLPKNILSHVSDLEGDYDLEMIRKEALRQESQRNIDRQKNWEYVTTIQVATGYNGPSYRYKSFKLYHKKGTSNNMLFDYSGEVTNYAVGDKLCTIRRNPFYGQAVNWNALSPQWGNPFQYSVYGVGGYFNL